MNLRCWPKRKKEREGAEKQKRKKERGEIRERQATLDREREAKKKNTWGRRENKGEEGEGD
jgi:hypothetical protein